MNRLISNVVSCAGRAPLLAVALAGAIAPAALGQFVPGDVYLATSYPGAGNPCSAGAVFHFEAATFNKTLVGHLGAGFSGRAAYDAYRGAIILGYNNGVLETMNADGQRAPLPPAGASSPLLFAPTGDGRIYFWNTVQQVVKYYDRDGVIHTLMDIVPSVGYHYPIQADALAYDATTNSLFFSSNAQGDVTQIAKVPLNAAGTQVTASVQVLTLDASPGEFQEHAVGFSRGPSGKLFLAIDDNGGGDVGRMQLIDPVNMTSQVYATSLYNGVGAELAGCYVPSRNFAVVFDTFNGIFRAYGQGQHGAGSALPAINVTNSCFVDPASQLLVIDPPAHNPADVAQIGGNGGSDGQLTADDVVFYLQSFFANNVAVADIAGLGGSPNPDGQISVDDLVSFLSAFFAGLH